MLVVPPPFEINNNLTLCRNSTYSDTSFDHNTITCNYYLPSELKDVISKDGDQTDYKIRKDLNTIVNDVIEASFFYLN